MKPWRVLVLVLLTMTFSLTSLAPAHACSCAFDLPTSVERADVVLRGTVVAVKEGSLGRYRGSQTRYSVRVIEVFKGTAGRTVHVSTEPIGGTCGVRLATGQDVTVVGLRQGRVIETDICRGTRGTTTATRTVLVDRLGAPRAPTPVDEPAPVERSFGDIARWGAGAVLLVLAAGVAAVVVRRRRPAATSPVRGR
ncbi:hypothetical protein PZ938_14840 [Luteipulveratus sp. YIM 133132]|uniref:hypothetical protein n=1 Tax=Luteipulveratus flavus TaxID=3031728 RepID=UPI0023B14636|nr:hypothetical protein [Luteipulveratus sp. YIM 133132]MDE9366890.1 hypothetical protein [Luteipulveratus sp. YIM 133132]